MTTPRGLWLLALGLTTLSLGATSPAQPSPRRYARRGEVCSVGERPGRVRPNIVARPCARGLRCCYPCGIPGCDSVCLRDCGPPRP